MKVTLVGVNAKFSHTNLAIRYLKNAAAKAGYDVAAEEYTINQPVAQVTQELVEKQSKLYAFSLYIWNVEYIKQVVKDIRKKVPEAGVLFGGPEATYCAAQLLEEHWCDYVIRGEGEKAFVAFLDFWTGKKSVEKVLSLSYLQNGQGVDNPSAPYMDMDELSIGYGDLASLKNRVIYYESQRGCPYQCAYCLSSIERGVRYKSIERVKEDLDAFAQAGIMKVKFVDRTFNSRPQRAYEILDYIIHSQPNLAVHFEIAADLLDEQTLLLLKDARPGQVQLEIGIQSTNLKTLRAIRRVQDFDKTARVVHWLVKNTPVHVHVDLIAGLPYEDLRSFQRSFDQVFSLYAQEVQLGFLKLIHGSALRSDKEKYEFVFEKKAPYEVRATNCISAEEMNFLKGIEYLCNRTYNSGLFVHCIKELARQERSPFEMLKRLSQFCQKQQIQPKTLTEAGMCELLYAFGEKMQNKQMAVSMLKLDCLLKKRRPKLIKSLEDNERERQISREYFQRYAGRFAMWGGKRPWHFARVERFPFDVVRYLERGEVHSQEGWYLFSYWQTLQIENITSEIRVMCENQLE